jgi:hypothetical protein
MIVIELDGFLDGGVQSVQRVCFLDLDDAAALRVSPVFDGMAIADSDGMRGV